MNLQPYLCFGGIEVINDLRTLTYMRRGLLPFWEVPLDLSTGPGPATTTVVNDVYVDLYGDAYGGAVVKTYDPFWPGNLACYCAAIDGGPYVSPAADDAPWYLASRPESGEFFGFLRETAELDSVLTRSVSSVGSAGASLGRMVPRHRVMRFSALMLASSSRGMAWGERWLTDVLTGNLCDDDDLVEAIVLPGCPPSNDADRYFRSLFQTGVIDGPIFTPQAADSGGRLPEYFAQQVSWQLASELPWLYAPPTPLGQHALGPGQSVSAVATTDAWVGDAGLRITIRASTTFSGRVTLTPMVVGATCPQAGASPCLDFTVTALPNDNVLTIDGARQEISELDGTSKQLLSGLNRLDFTGRLGFPEVPPCSSVCCTVACTAGSASVTVEQFNREL